MAFFTYMSIVSFVFSGLNDQPAVFDIRLVDKLRKATYIGNKKQPPVAHFFF